MSDTLPSTRSKAEIRADEIVAEYEACTSFEDVRRTMRRAQESMDALAQLPDTRHWKRAGAARAEAWQRYAPTPEVTP
ncbi:hypothetical protein [Roseomonas populi]|uniref:Uncharacterized protein n=1 Tax=Roseomonas populi TaxID=3121582 RepID=A0ABT1X142_9PROT|nr:hypothetical protein [Roseomonas pecuniae]MCR0981822.1 hypothetical protein [Roseomonas pecuniae]